MIKPRNEYKYKFSLINYEKVPVYNNGELTPLSEQINPISYLFLEDESIKKVSVEDDYNQLTVEYDDDFFDLTLINEFTKISRLSNRKFGLFAILLVYNRKEQLLEDKFLNINHHETQKGKLFIKFLFQNPYNYNFTYSGEEFEIYLSERKKFFRKSRIKKILSIES